MFDISKLQNNTVKIKNNLNIMAKMTSLFFSYLSKNPPIILPKKIVGSAIESINTETLPLLLCTILIKATDSIVTEKAAHNCTVNNAMYFLKLITTFFILKFDPLIKGSCDIYSGYSKFT